MNKNRDEEEKILQDLNEEILTSIEINFKKSQITEVIGILFILLAETNAKNHKMKINFNDRDLGIYTYKNILDKNEILIEVYYLVVNKEKLIIRIVFNVRFYCFIIHIITFSIENVFWI